MKLRVLILSFFLFCTFNSQGQDKLKLSADYKGLSFNEFVALSEKLLDVRFYYREEWVSDLKLGDYPGSSTLPEVLDNLFRGTSIFYYIDKHNNIVLTRNYEVKKPGKAAPKTSRLIPPTDYSASAESNQNSGNTLVEIGNPAEKNRPGNAVISGYIRNKDSKEPVAGVTVYIKKLSSGTVSNEYGFFNLSVPRGNHIIQFSFIGMREKTVRVDLFGTGELNVEMNSILIPLKETVVSAQKNVTLQRYEVGAEKVNITSFKLLPTSLGEADIIKSMLLIPGVQSVGEGSAGFNVRGGSSDQNLILLYGAPLYNTSHFFGFFSAVNSDIIKDVTLYKGGIPSRYGGRISSVMDIGSREGNMHKFIGNAGISPVTTHISVEGPIIKDTLSYMLSARTTYSNWLFGLINSPLLHNSKASFYDINGKLTWDFNKNNRIDVSAYASHDGFRFNSDTTYNYRNSIFAVKWRHFFNSRIFTSISVNNSFYDYAVSGSGISAQSFVLAHSINSTGFKADFNWFQGRNELNSGIELNRYSVLPGSFLPASDSSVVFPHTITKERALEGALYADDKLVLSELFSVNFGLRFSIYNSYGPKNVMVYDPAFSKSLSSITDTLNFRRGEVTSRYGGPEFRISFNYRISNRNSLKINYNRTRQYLHQLSNSTSVSPIDIWKLSDYYLKPQIGDQIALGYSEMLWGNKIEASAEIYYKTIRNMVDFKGGADFIMNETIEKDIVNVSGKAYGLELVVKKNEGNIRYSVAYTYSRTLIRSIGSFKDEILNSGKWFPASFDKPNDLVVTLNYIYSRRFSISSNYTWSTGRPITYPVSSYYMYDDMLIHYSDRNHYRIPDYSRLDLSFKVNGNLKANRLGHPVWTFSVFNLLGRQNVYSVFFRKEGDIYKAYKLSVFGTAIPSLTFSFDF